MSCDNRDPTLSRAGNVRFAQVLNLQIALRVASRIQMRRPRVDLILNYYPNSFWMLYFFRKKNVHLIT